MVGDITNFLAKKDDSFALRAETTGELYWLAGEMIVGRQIDCDIRLESRRISRYHAKLHVETGGLYVTDLDSSNGTFVNQRKISTRTPVNLGDKLAFDEHIFQVTTCHSSHSDQTQFFDPGQMIASHSDNVASLPRLSVQPVSTGSHDAVSEPEDNEPKVAAGSFGIKPAPEPKIHAIEDVDEFLRHAGSALVPQKPLAGKEAFPFGLSRTQKIEEGGNNELPQQQIVHGSLETDDKSASHKDKNSVKKTSRQNRKKGARRQVKGQARTPAQDNNMLNPAASAVNQYLSANENIQSELYHGSGPRLIALSAPIRGKVFSLSAVEDVRRWSVGRGDNVDVCIRDQAVSHQHAWITKLNNDFQLRVNKAASGILINGRTKSDARLVHGDKLQLGAMELVFRVDVKTEKMSTWTKLKSWLSPTSTGIAE